MATLRRRESLHFPAREHAKLRLARLLPARLRDPMTRRAMDPPEIESPTPWPTACRRLFAGLAAAG